MKLEKLKRDFISYMEEVHSGNPYPRNLIGCLMAISVDSEPVSQERIMELTGYNRATVSLAIQKIQLLLSVRTVKKKKDRRHYYVYENAAHAFVLDLLQRRVDVQDIDTKLIDSLLRKARDREDRNELAQFETYLENMHLYLNLIHEIRSASVVPFKHALAAGSTEGLSLEDTEVLEEGELASFLIELKETSSKDTDFIHQDHPHDFVQLKNEYFTGIKTGLNPLFSQDIANRLIVVHSILVAGQTTQEQIEQVTLLPRSTISEVLTQVVQRGIIRVSGSRPKYYEPAISFSNLMLASFDRVANYISSVGVKLSDFRKVAMKVSRKPNEEAAFVEFLRDLEDAYSLALEFSRSMKVKTVKRLKEEFERGFVFI
jgi:DNA-binding transcriptional regulator GbsR (MarR family)